MLRISACILMLTLGCAEPKPIPGVISPKPGETLSRIPGPMPDFGPFGTVEEAIFAACPLTVSQPNALIPVRKTDQNFGVYWRTAQEYCAWLYSPDERGKVLMDETNGQPRKTLIGHVKWNKDGTYEVVP